MRSVKSLIAAGAATLISSAAFAADMAIAPPPPMYAPPPVVEDFGGWYLRGDIGFSNQRVERLNNALDAAATTSVQNNSFNTAGIFGLGVGYKVNNWFRADVTGEYRGNSQFFGTDRITYRGRRRHRHLSRHQERVGRSRQRLCRSRHLVVHDPVHRRRRRRRAGLDQQLHRPEHRQQRRRRAAGPRLRRQRRRSGTSPGHCTPVSPTRSRRTSPSNWPIAISTWVTA